MQHEMNHIKFPKNNLNNEDKTNSRLFSLVSYSHYLKGEA